MKLALIDFNRTIYDPETDAAVPGAADALSALQQRGYTLVLISRKEAARAEKLTLSGLAQYFHTTLFVEEKSAELFKSIMKTHNATPEETLVLGDHPYEEIRYGNEVGAKTVRLMRGKFVSLKPIYIHDTAWRSIHELTELSTIVI